MSHLVCYTRRMIIETDMKATKKTLDQFIDDVDTVITQTLFCSLHDLPDTICFSDYYDEDESGDAKAYKNMVMYAAEDLAYDNGFKIDDC